MARQDFNLVTHHTSGHLGKQVVFRQYKGRTIIAKYPDMSNVKRSEKQVGENSLFRQAVAFGRMIKADPSQLTDPSFVMKNGQSVYHAAVSWYLRQHSSGKQKGESKNSSH